VTVLNGAIRAIGKQGIASVNNFIVFYVIYIPLAYYLSLHFNKHKSYETETYCMELSGLGQKGLWIGGTIALTYKIFCMHYILFGLSDWK